MIWYVDDSFIVECLSVCNTVFVLDEEIAMCEKYIINNIVYSKSIYWSLGV